MIIKNEFCKLTFLKNTNQISNQCKLWPSHIEYKCESCGILKDEKYNIFKNRFNIINLVQCGKCSRSLLARYATMKGQYDENGKLTRIVENYKNVILPTQVIYSIYKAYPKWTIVNDKFLYTQEAGDVIKKQYNVKIKKDNEVKRIVIKSDGEILKIR